MDSYMTEEFLREYTYTGTDLGAVWSKESTTFRVWAPMAQRTEVALYKSGTAGTDDRIKKYALKKEGQGVWSVTVEGDLHGIYYTYLITRNGAETEACDPYAKTTGVNGRRAMVIDLERTNPAGWKEDRCPHPELRYTDMVLYELHVRDFSMDESAGITPAYRGKFLAFTERGTRTAKGAATGLDYLRTLGITHLHLLPLYDYGSVDEARLNEPQFNWGYDPVNYNVPEGSYATDPYHGEVRVREMKQMVKALHDNGINVVMDVVYNHVYDAESFCFNRIVPGYFSRMNADGSYSNGSYCGNDTASERPMVRKYIVDSVLYWVKEYHIDGFRFDLVGLLDVETINKITETVHAKYPHVIFYGEGWSMNTSVPEGVALATQRNAEKTPAFAYFSDNIRDLLAGRNGGSLGFVSGQSGCEEEVRACFLAQEDWCPKPSQTVNYVSCHDNYTLFDKLRLTRPHASMEELVRMNKLAAAVYILAQGIPFLHAGEEFLRMKENEAGEIIENSYNASDYVNRLRWSDLEKQVYAEVSAYYRGLLAFRKKHAVLRMAAADEAAANIRYHKVSDGVVLFELAGRDCVKGEVSDGMVVIFNASTAAKKIGLCEYGASEGQWKVYINGRYAGTEVLDIVTKDTVTAEPVSALVLVRER